MNRRFGYALAALCAPLVLAVGAANAADAPAAKKPMNYDCTKAGNKNKAACKGAAATPATKATPATPATKATPATTTTAATPATKATPATPATPATAAAPKKALNYDCTKAGNKNKQACKDAAPVAVTPPAAPARAASVPAKAAPAAAAATAVKSGNIVEWKTTTGKIVHYDCDKAGNKTKQACKGR